MSKRELDVQRELRILRRQEQGYQYAIELLDHLKRKISLIENAGFTRMDLAPILGKYGFTDSFPLKVERWLQNAQKDLNATKQAGTILDKRLKETWRPETSGHYTTPLPDSLDKLIIIPSWSRIFGSNYLGLYGDQKPTEIISDPVLFLTSLTFQSVDETTNETFLFTTGFGMYWLKFSMAGGKIVTTNRPFHGLIIPLEVWSRAEASEAIALMGEESEAHLAEDLITLPFKLLLPPESRRERTKQMFLKGIITRNIIHPMKETFQDFEKVCRFWDDQNNIRVLLGGISSGDLAFLNEILVEKPAGDYMHSIPGIRNIQDKLGLIETELRLDRMREGIIMASTRIRNDFVSIGHKLLFE